MHIFFFFLNYIYCLDSQWFVAMNTTGKLDGNRTKDIFSHRWLLYFMETFIECIS